MDDQVKAGEWIGKHLFAFPANHFDLADSEHGMTLRDYFAAHANVEIYTPLENLTAQLHRKPTIGEMAEYIASIRTIEADAMMKERNK